MSPLSIESGPSFVLSPEDSAVNKADENASPQSADILIQEAGHEQVSK